MVFSVLPSLLMFSEQGRLSLMDINQRPPNETVLVDAVPADNAIAYSYAHGEIFWSDSKKNILVYDMKSKRVCLILISLSFFS